MISTFAKVKFIYGKKYIYINIYYCECLCNFCMIKFWTVKSIKNQFQTNRKKPIFAIHLHCGKRLDFRASSMKASVFRVARNNPCRQGHGQGLQGRPRETTSILASPFHPSLFFLLRRSSERYENAASPPTNISDALFLFLGIVRLISSLLTMNQTFFLPLQTVV